MLLGTDFSHDPGQSVQLIRVEGLWLSVVGDTQDQTAAL